MPWSVIGWYFIFFLSLPTVLVGVRPVRGAVYEHGAAAAGADRCHQEDDHSQLSGDNLS